MTQLRPPLRRARIEDAPVLAELVNHAGEGMPLYFWEQLASPGQTPMEVGVSRAARESGSFSYRNAFVVESEGVAAGCLIGYGIPDRPEPVSPDMPAMVRPLQELENLAPGTWYVNVLAILPAHRSSGFGSRLLGLADELGRAAGKRGMSVIVSDANPGARRLYERCGYREAGTRPMVKEGCVNEGRNWVLLTKDI
jgi:ribosomal protein S18 acetylase RimI-like enzyme